MEKLDELLEQEKEYEAFMYAKEKVIEKPSYLEALFDLEITTKYTEEDKKYIDKFQSFLGTKYEWITKLVQDICFQEIRENVEYKELVGQIKNKLSNTHKEKAIELEENQWTDLELIHTDSEFPKVKVALTFDKEFLKIKAEVKDTHFLDGNRSWRYGDGFFINFTMPEGEEKDECIDTKRFYSLGFSMEEGESRGVLVNHNGTYYLRSNNAIEPEINIDKDKMIANYNIKIPFSFLKPFDPLIDEISGFYIRYTSQNDDSTRAFVYLINDNNSDSEMTNYRRFVPVKYNYAKTSQLRLAGLLNNRLIKDDICEMKIYFYAPKQIDGSLKIQIKDSEGNNLKEYEKKISLNIGRNILNEDFKIKDFGTGSYKINLTFKDESWEEIFYKYNQDVIKETKEKILALKKFGDDTLLKNSIHSLSYRLQQIEKKIKDHHPRDDPSKIEEIFTEINNLIIECEKNESIYKRTGYLLSAFQSPFDDSLQPYSMTLPNDFDPNKEYTLLVGMHGSGVDEVGFIRFIGKNMAEIGYDKFLLVGPRGRDLSDCYIGQSEFDVVDLINETKKMFIIKKTIIFGFSMGGYGTWRMTFLHPELFDAAIIAAGFPHFDGKSENDMRNYIGKSKDIDFLVIHGTADRSVSIKETDEFIENLKKEGYSIQYNRLKDQDHGNLDVGPIMAKWLEKYKD